MYWTPVKMLLLADVEEYSFANAAVLKLQQCLPGANELNSIVVIRLSYDYLMQSVTLVTVFLYENTPHAVTPHREPAIQTIDVFFVVCLNKQLNTHYLGQWNQIHLPFKQLGNFFPDVILLSNVVLYKCNIFVWNWSNSTNLIISHPKIYQ